MKCRDCEHWGWGDDEGTPVWGWCWIRTSCLDPDIERTCPAFSPKAPNIFTTLSTLQAENEKLRAELEQVKRERDAAQVTLAETSGLAGGVVQTLFGVPLERMRELAKAELEGRIVLRSAGAGKKCGSCGNFHRIPGTKRGTCAIRQWERNRLGQTEHWRHSFTPSQSYGACRYYIPREDDNHG